MRNHAFERELLKPLGLSVEQLWAGLTACHHVLGTPPLTLCHGDAHVQNTFVVEASSNGRGRSHSRDGECGFFDFQLSLRASWCRDVSYLVATSLSPEERRLHEDELIEHYLTLLRAAGGDPPAEVGEAMRLYAVGMAWGLVIGWLT